MKKGTAVIYKKENSNLYGEFGTITDIKDDGTYMVHFECGDVDINAKENELEETIRMEATGCICNTTSGERKADICMSGIYSFLVKEVGTKVSSYQSDIIYDINMIQDAIDNLRTEEFLIGLRESGVDSKTFIEAGKREYIDIYYIFVNVNVKTNDIKVILEKWSES